MDKELDEIMQSLETTMLPIIKKVEILKDENEDSLKDEVNDFIKDKSDAKLTWSIAFDHGGTIRQFVCFIEYLGYDDKEE